MNTEFSREELIVMSKNKSMYLMALMKRVVSEAESVDVRAFVKSRAISFEAWDEICKAMLPKIQELLDLEIESALADEKWEKENYH